MLCVVFQFGVWNPYFLELECVTVTVTLDQYCDDLFDEHGRIVSIGLCDCLHT